MVEKQVENVTKEIDSKIQLSKEEEDPFENVKKEKEEEATVVKTKTAEELGMENLDLAVLENVGNLVCPAEFDTGSSLNIAILSVPEGDDKPLKYPLMFEVCDVVLINKVDVLPYFDFDIEKSKENIHYRNKNAKVFEICAKSGEGIKLWCDYLLTRIREWKE